MKKPERPKKQDPCIAEFKKVDKEIMKMEEEDEGKPPPGPDKVCEKFRGFKEYCKKEDWDKVDKTDRKPTGDEKPLEFEDIMKAEKQMCSPCGKGFLELQMMSEGQEDGEKPPPKDGEKPPPKDGHSDH